MFDLIKVLFTSTKPHHVISGSLFIMLSFAIFHVYGEQEKMNERKADNASVERMLLQNERLLALQEKSKSGNDELQRLLVANLLVIESRVTQTQAEQNEKLTGVMLQQELLKAQLEKQLEQNLEILKQIERVRVQLNSVTNN